jgi:isocitrate/isopropylmalate dehydrogenase
MLSRCPSYWPPSPAAQQPAELNFGQISPFVAATARPSCAGASTALRFFQGWCVMQMVRAPEMFEIIVTNNMFGDIVTDLGAALQGGLGVAASGNIHPGRVSMFEPIHGSAPKYAGKDVSNPAGAILTAAMMLDYLGHADEGAAIESAVVAAIEAGETTKDLGGSLGTQAAGDAVVRRLESVGR